MKKEETELPYFQVVVNIKWYIYIFTSQNSLCTFYMVGIIQYAVFLYPDDSETPSRSLKSGKGDKIIA